MNNCPCCSNQMLRHIRHHQVYWFCRSCWQEMPLMQPTVSLITNSFGQRPALSNLVRSPITV